MNIRENIPISTLTTMRLGGEARYVIEIRKVSDVAAAYDFAKEQGLPVFVLGDGANTIGYDEGFDGVILLNRLQGVQIMREVAGEILIQGMGGENWDSFVEFSTKRGYSGIEAMSAIPGTLGAAPVQNIGAYGQEIRQVLDSVEVYDTKAHRILRLRCERLQFGYRRSIFNTGNQVGRYFIISVTVRLRRGRLTPPFYNSLQRFIDENGETDFSPANIRRMVSEIRAAKLPDPKVEASSGSFFKNVIIKDDEVAAAEAQGIKVWQEEGKNKINSGFLIEEAGLKGKELHGMRVSETAALILINDHAKSYAELAAAREEIRAAVKEKFGYFLEQEPVEIPKPKQVEDNEENGADAEVAAQAKESKSDSKPKDVA